MDRIDSSSGTDDWDRHWADFASAAQQNPAQRYRHRLALRLLERHGPPERVLDIGSGQGDLIAAAATRWAGAELAGVEVSAHGVELSRQKVPRAVFHQADLLADHEPPPGMAGWATHAVCSEVLEHVDDPARLLRNVRAWLAPGCRIVVTVPGGPMSAFDRHIGHRTHFTANAVRDVLVSAGFVPLLATGAGFPFFNVYRGVVIARGEKVADDAASPSGSLLARLAMLAFRPLFALNLPRSPYGWQTLAVASTPAVKRPSGTPGYGTSGTPVPKP